MATTDTSLLPTRVREQQVWDTVSMGWVAMLQPVISTDTLNVTIPGSIAVTGTFFQATQPVSAASLPLPTGASTEATLAALNAKVTAVNTGAVVVTSAPTTAVTGTFFQATQPVSAASLPLPTGAATETTQLAQMSRADTFKTRSDTFTGTTAGVTVDASASPMSAFSVQVKGTGGIATLWTVVVEGSLNNVDFTTILTHATATLDAVVLWTGALEAPTLYFRTRVTALTLGPATNIVVTVLGQN